MTPVTSITDLDQAVAAVRRQADHYVTNLYSDRPSLEQWVADRSLTQVTTETSLLLVRQRDDFNQLYFAAINQDALSNTLQQTLSEITRPVIVDLIGPASAIKPIGDNFLSHGFRLRERLLRLSVVPPFKRSSHVFPSNLHVVEARPTDVEWISAALSADFDPLVDQFPSHEELDQLIANRHVLVCLIQDQPAGFVLCYRNGSTALVKYWYVSPAFRGQGVGSALMSALVEPAPRPKRVLLWVKDRNQVAIERYEHYGFQREGLVDEVYCLEEVRR